jgi:hypothetical protein
MPQFMRWFLLQLVTMFCSHYSQIFRRTLFLSFHRRFYCLASSWARCANHGRTFHSLLSSAAEPEHFIPPFQAIQLQFANSHAHAGSPSGCGIGHRKRRNRLRIFDRPGHGFEPVFSRSAIPGHAVQCIVAVHDGVFFQVRFKLFAAALCA